MDLKNELQQLGLDLEIETGHLFYGELTNLPKYEIDLILVRHGETYGNCGQSTATGKIDDRLVKLNIKDRTKRIYQGDVDTEINQLTIVGKQQSIDAAMSLEKLLEVKAWLPDVIFHSPLTRARETGLPFVERNQFHNRYFMHEGIKEMCFGAWNNRRICDMKPDHSCHLFYLNQNALIKESGHNAQGLYQEAECFAEVLLRANRVLRELEKDHAGKKILFFSHSMFGMACSILFGQGRLIEGVNCLAFDGTGKGGLVYCLPHAHPVFLSNAQRPKK